MNETDKISVFVSVLKQSYYYNYVLKLLHKSLKQLSRKIMF